MKILLIEDNQTIANNIKRYLALEDWWEVDLALDGDAGKEKFDDNEWYYNIIILDLMLPEIDGEFLCKYFKSYEDVPIIITSAKSQLENKQELFDKWADDYMTKPFELQELVMRVKALTNRYNSNNIKTIWDISINTETREIKKNKENIKTTNKEFLIFKILVENNGRPVSRTDIIDEVWGDDWMFQWDDKLDVYISNLRKKLWKTFIQTIKGFGYKVG